MESFDVHIRSSRETPAVFSEPSFLILICDNLLYWLINDNYNLLTHGRREIPVGFYIFKSTKFFRIMFRHIHAASADGLCVSFFSIFINCLSLLFSAVIGRFLRFLLDNLKQNIQ